MHDSILSRRKFLQTSAAFSLAGCLWLKAGSIAIAAPIPSRKPKAPRLLMLDPGHGGRDPGAISKSGTQEKDITLDIARKMAEFLTKIPGVDVKLTRDSDVFLPLEERVRIGREARSDLFMSIHADSAPNPAARGLSVYTLSSKASDDLAKNIADQENKADLMGGLDIPSVDKEVTAILMDLAARQTRNTAQRVRANFVTSVGRNWQLLESPMRAANFAVLRAPDVPSVLVETGFLSNPKDEKLLKYPKHREKIAKIMAKSIAEIMKGSLFS